MEIKKARETVTLAGKKLVQSGLIARTWGNVSCRIDKNRFAITPSGLAYETLSPEEIVTVNIEDCSHEGEIKPSSEKGIHAQVYRSRPEIEFIIHTHQVNASVVSPLQIDIPVDNPESAAVTGSPIGCAAYALPGTKKLRQAVAAALSRSAGRAFLLAYHGALCLGKDHDEAFAVAAELEKVCADFVLRRLMELGGHEKADEEILRNYYLRQAFANGKITAKPLYNSERCGDEFRLFTGAGADDPFPGNYLAGRLSGSLNRDLPPEAAIHQAIYRRQRDVNAIIHSASPDVIAVSKAVKRMLPLLDDFAQIIGPDVRSAELSDPAGDADTIAKKLKGRGAVLVRGHGALCCGPTRGDAMAAALVMEKGCKTEIGCSLFGKVKPINPLDCRLMRFIYLKRYSKKGQA